jgi:hypothetical protein
MVMRAWATRHDLLLAVYFPWLVVLAVVVFGWPWAW